MIASTWIPAWMDQLGWVLVHFVWEGALIGMVTWIALLVLRKSSTRIRYGLLCTALLACGVSPCLTWIALDKGTQLQFDSGTDSSRESGMPQTAKPTLINTAPSGEPSFFSAGQPAPSSAWNLEGLSPAIQVTLPYFVTLWGLGVSVLSLRLLYGWIQLRGLCASGVPLKDQDWIGRMKALADRMGVRGTIVLLESALVEVPTVIGWLRPVILVPVTFFTGMPLEQIEAILAHELAHIRRHDYLVNLVQIAVETLLFYHPVVWWISRAIRQEREHCCDDLALQIVGDKAIYASALAALEESRSLPMAITLAATGGSLLQRLKRIAGPDGRRVSLLPVLGTILVVVIVLGALAWEMAHRFQAQKDTGTNTDLLPAQPMTVICTDKSGVPVSGAEVYLVEFLNQPRFGSEAIETVRTQGPIMSNSDGRAVFKDTVANKNHEWRRSVYARIPGKLAGGIYREQSTETSSKGAAPSSMQVTLLPPVTLHGHVEVPHGFSVTSVKVNVLDWSVGEDFRSQSSFFGTLRIPHRAEPWPNLVEFAPDAQGRVTIPDVPVGCNLYLSGNAPGLGEAQYMTFGARAPPDEFSLSLDHEGSIQGKVQDRSGTGVGGVLVACRAVDAQMYVTHAYHGESDGFGHFRIGGLPSARFEVQVVPPDGLVSMPQEDVKVSSGRVATANMTVEPGVWVAGEVKDKQTGRGIPKVGLAFIGGDNTVNGNAYTSAETDADGKFKIELPEGSSTSYFWRFPEEYLPLQKQGETVIKVVSGQTPPPMIFELTAKGAGVPKDSPYDAQPAVAHGRVLDPSGKPMAGVDVSSDYTPNKGVDTFPQGYGHVLTEGDGSYTLSLLPYGTCHIIAGGVTSSSVNSKDFPTAPRSQIHIEDLTVRPATASVSGKVVDESGKPLANIEVKGGSEHKRALGNGIRTDLDGKFTLGHLLSDEPVELEARGSDFSSGEAYAAPSSSDTVIILHSNKLRTVPPSTPHSLPDLIGKPAPDWIVDAWTQTVSGTPSPKRSDGRWTLLEILWSIDVATPEHLKELSEAAQGLKAEAVVIFVNQFKGSLLKKLLAGQSLSGINVGVDKYLFDENDGFGDGVTHTAYRGGYFLIDPAGIVRGVERFKPLSEVRIQFKTIVAKIPTKAEIVMPTRNLIVHVQDTDGSTLSGASAKAEGPNFSADLTTGADGTATISLPAALPQYLSVHVRKEGFVPKLIEWTLDQPSFTLPSDFTLRMEKAQTIGGVVKNDDGQPVAGAKVVLIIRGSSMGGVAQQVFNDIWERRVTTDKDGKWHFDEAPFDLRSLQVTLEHPDYVSNERIDSRPSDDDFKNQTALLILHKGTPVDGDVTDESGKPISGVDVVFGEAGSGSITFPSAKTDTSGHFHFGGLSLKGGFGNGPILTFTSADYAPEMVGLSPVAGGQRLKVVLKVGKQLRVRFTDKQGQPVKGVTLCPDNWRGHRPFGCIRFQSDQDGQVVWDHAPDDSITYAMLADSYQNQALVLQPKDGVQTIKLKHPTVVSGRVLDATTRQPITNYDLIFGAYYPEKDPFWSSWARGAVMHLKTDSYSYVFENRAVMGSPTATEPATEGFHRIRIEAPGYEPGVSRPIANDEESVSIDFQLKRAPAIHGMVTAADGSPVKNAQIVVAGPGNAVQITDGFCRDKWDKQIINTNDQGEYDLPAQEADFPIAIIQPDAGYLTTSYSALKASLNVKLLPWGELDISTTAKKDTNPQCFVRYVDEDQASSQLKRIRFQTYRPTESRDGLNIYRHLVAGAVRIGQYGQAIDEGQVIQIANGETQRFDWKTGAPAVVNTNPTPAGSTPAIQTATLVVHVVDSAGKPVSGAIVRPIGLRSREEPGSYYFGSPSGRAIAIQTGITDADGNATISFPAHPMDNLTTGVVAVLVEHPDSCTANVELNVDAPRPVTLDRGTMLNFAVSPVPGVTFSRVYADIDGDRRQAAFLKWEHSSDGQSVSSRFPDGKYLVRMVGVTDEGKVYFSVPSLITSPLQLDQHSANRAIGDNIAAVSSPGVVFELKEGHTFRGKLDDTVPRPVKGGWIVAQVTSPALDPNYWSAPVNGWRTSAEVAEDGTFVLTNLPSGTLEIVAGSDGYVSKDTSIKPIGGIRQAQVIPESQNQPITIPMEPTGDARVTVQAPDGKPLAGATVYFNPNQMLGRGTNILGTRSNSLEMLRNRDSDPDLLANSRPSIPQFSAKTDANGVAIVKGLPAGRQNFFVQSESFDMPIQSDQPPSSPGQIWVPRRIGTITVAPPVEGSAQVKMEPKGSTSLSAAMQGGTR